jgi:hypothetical protein
MSEATDTYIYGIVRAQSAVPPTDAAGVGEPAGSVRVVTSGPIAALVSDAPPAPMRATRADLSRHMEVLQRASADATVVPLRFGTIMPDDQTLRAELLDARRPTLERLLDELDGRVELSLKGIYEETVFAEILAERREIAQLRERVARVPEAASYYDRIRLGELVSAALDERRQRDAGAVLSRLAPLADDVVDGELTHERAVFNAAFLVRRDRVEAFDAAAAAVADEHSGRITFRYAGPLPPFNFVRWEDGSGWG